MARNIKDRTNVDPVDATNPYGKPRDESIPGADDGTPYNESLHSDSLVFFQKLMDERAITPNENPDDENNGFQLYEAFVRATGSAFREYLIPVSKGTEVAFPGGGSIAAIDSRVIALGYFTNPNYQLQAYQVGNNGTFSSVGNLGPSVGNDFPRITGMKKNRVALTYYNNTNDLRLETWDFDGTNWSQTGNTLALTTPTQIISITRLSDDSVALCYDIAGFDGELAVYTFDGTDWSLTGNTFDTNHNVGDIEGLENNKILYESHNDEKIRLYSFDGTNWALEDSISENIGDPGTFIVRQSSDLSVMIDGFKITFISVNQTSNEISISYSYTPNDFSVLGTGIGEALFISDDEMIVQAGGRMFLLAKAREFPRELPNPLSY